GTVVTAVGGGGSSVTISPSAKSTCSGTLSARIGNAVVSPGNILAASGSSAPYPGAQFIYNIIDNTGPSYTEARNLVGYQDAPTAPRARSALRVTTPPTAGPTT